jgi:3-oxoacyl-[acyl-carrier protein] reductase
VVEERRAARAEPAVGQRDVRFAHALQARVEPLEFDRPLGIAVDVGDVAAPAALELVGEDREEGSGSAAELDDVGRGAGRLRAHRHSGRSRALRNEEERVAAGEAAEPPELVARDQDEARADPAAPQLRQGPAGGVRLVGEPDLHVDRFESALGGRVDLGTGVDAEVEPPRARRPRSQLAVDVADVRTRNHDQIEPEPRQLLHECAQLARVRRKVRHRGAVPVEDDGLEATVERGRERVHPEVKEELCLSATVGHYTLTFTLKRGSAFLTWWDTRAMGRRVALASGSSRGLGRFIALRLAGDGLAVAVNGLHDDEQLVETVEAIRRAGGVAEGFTADVTDERQVAELVASVDAGLGPVEVLVLNATGPQPEAPLEEVGWEDHLAQLDFFVKSPVLLGRAVVPGMRARGWGRIVHVDSEVADLPPPGRSAYVTAKSAQIGLARSWARELAPFGITVNMVAPGFVPVERHADVSADEKDAYLSSVPAGRMGTPDDIAHAVSSFASEHAGFITGQRLVVDGGRGLG